MPQRRDTLKNPEQELRIFRVRALLAVLVVIVLTSLLVSRLGYLQIVQHDLYSTRSEKNRSLCRLTAGLSMIVTVRCWRKTVLPTTLPWCVSASMI